MDNCCQANYIGPYASKCSILDVVLYKIATYDCIFVSFGLVAGNVSRGY